MHARIYRSHLDISWASRLAYPLTAYVQYPYE